MKSDWFPKLILFSAIGLASIAGYFSIFGISSLFSGAVLPVGLMALFLEIGKLCSVSFVFRYWEKIKVSMRVYMCLASFILIVITSTGIGGFLMSAYQKSSIQYQVSQTEIQNLELQKPGIEEKLLRAKKRIDILNSTRNSQEDRLNIALTNSFFERNPIQLKQLQQQTLDSITQSDENIKLENKSIDIAIHEQTTLNDKINELRLKTTEKKDIQTFKFIADAFHTSLDSVVKWLILTLIFVFDPLAICLILAYNVATFQKQSSPILPKPAINDRVSSSPTEPVPKIDDIKNDIISPPTEVSPQNNAHEPQDGFFRSYFKK